jgi:hypothetical protein
VPKLPDEFQDWRTRFHGLLREAVAATPLRFDYTADERTLFMTHPSGGFDVRAVLSAGQHQGIVFVRRRTELVVPTKQPQAMAIRVQSILATAMCPEFPVANPGEHQHVQHTGEFPLTWEHMRENEHQSIGWYLYHVIRLHDLFGGNLRSEEVRP